MRSIYKQAGWPWRKASCVSLSRCTRTTERYGVIVTDLPGCFSAGDTLDEAIEMAREAIDAHVELLIEGGEAVPERRAVALHRSNPDYAGAVWAVVDVPVEHTFLTAPNKPRER